MKTNKIIAGVLSLCLMGGAMPLTENTLPGFTASASSTEEHTIETKGKFQYYKFSNRIEICGYNKDDLPVGDIVIPSTIDGLPVTVIRAGTFSDYAGLTSVTISEGITTIENGIFNGCAGLKAVKIPASVTTIGKNVFSDCDDLTDIKVATGNKKYYDKNGVLFNNGELMKYPVGKADKKYAVPNGTVSICDGAFYGCENLTLITLPDTLKSIGNSAFIGCGITSMTIPDSVTSIGEKAFEYCVSLESVKLSKNLTAISRNMFLNCSSLLTVTIPDSVTSVGFEAFMKCWGLYSITVPKNVTSIESAAFDYSCLYIIIENPKCEIADNESTFCGDTMLFGQEGSTAQAYAEKHGRTFVTYKKYSDHIEIISCSNLNYDELVIPAEIEGLPVTAIGDSAFKGCDSLVTAEIPESITSIGNSAFSECDNLTSITICNPECEINNSKTTIPEAAVICGYDNSTAQAYAEKNGRNFESLGEAPVKTKLGDVDFDGKVDSSDASRVLAEYALTATGHEATFTDKQKKSADVNSDGKVDSSDASSILAYYAYKATGGDKTLEEFLKK